MRTAVDGVGGYMGAVHERPNQHAAAAALCPLHHLERRLRRLLHPSAGSGVLFTGMLAHRNECTGETREVPYLLTWYFPNRYVNYDQQWLGPCFLLCACVCVRARTERRRRP